MASWNDTDLDDRRDDGGTAHENILSTPNTDASQVRHGYSYQGPDLTSGLVGWWPLADTSAQDYSGNGNDGTVNGATAEVAGIGGLQAFSFDGGNDDVDTGSIFFNDMSSPFTLSAWVRHTGGAPEKVLSNTETGGFEGVQLGINGSNQWAFFIRTNDTNAEASTANNEDNEWVHLVGVNTGSQIELFVNGTSVDTVSHSRGTVSNALDNMHIGSRGGNDQHWGGEICEARIYDRALSSREVSALYEWGSADLARDPTDGLARYALDGDATDSFGTNDGTNNGATFVSDSIRGQAGDFDGTTDNITCGDSTTFNFERTDPFSLFVWVSSSNNGNRIFAKDDPSNGFRGYGLGRSGANQLVLELTNTSPSNQLRVETDDTIPADTWMFVGFTYDGTSSANGVNIYFNGVQKSFHIDQNSLSSTIQSSVSPTIGSRPDDSNFYDGKIDDVRIYDRALSEQEVFELYRWGTFGRDMRKDLVTK